MKFASTLARQRFASGGECVLRGARASDRAVAGHNGKRHKYCQGRLYAASLLLGVLRGASEFSRNYAMNRERLAAIAHHQGGISYRRYAHGGRERALAGARCALKIDCARTALSTPRRFCRGVEASRFIGPNGVQILAATLHAGLSGLKRRCASPRALGL